MSDVKTQECNEWAIADTAMLHDLIERLSMN